MPEPTATAVGLARLRAAGVQARPAGAAYGAWHAASGRAGRRLVDVSRPGTAGRVALGWADGAEPVGGAHSGVERVSATPVLGLTFAAVLRACWADRSEHPFPGRLTTESRVLAAVASTGLMPPSTAEAAQGSVRHQKGALRRLTEAGYIEVDRPYIRLGTQVALWSEVQVAALRVIYQQLPSVTDDWFEPAAATAAPAADDADWAFELINDDDGLDAWEGW